MLDGWDFMSYTNCTDRCPLLVTPLHISAHMDQRGYHARWLESGPFYF